MTTVGQSVYLLIRPKEGEANRETEDNNSAGQNLDHPPVTEIRAEGPTNNDPIGVAILLEELTVIVQTADATEELKALGKPSVVSLGICSRLD